MAKRRTRLKAKRSAEGATVTCLIKHPMETGNRLGADGNKIPIHYIKVVRFSVNGEQVAATYLGPGVSADPLLTLDIADVTAGDEVAVQWEDNRGETGTAETVAK